MREIGPEAAPDFTIEQDWQGGIHVAVWLDEAHRMYFDPAEIEII